MTNVQLDRYDDTAKRYYAQTMGKIPCEEADTAAFLLGTCYEAGEHVGVVDGKLAMAFYEKAIELGRTSTTKYGASFAYCNLAHIFHQGKYGVPKDLQKEHACYVAAVELDELPEALFELGQYHHLMLGDYAKAISYYERAIKTGAKQYVDQAKKQIEVCRLQMQGGQRPAPQKKAYRDDELILLSLKYLTDDQGEIPDTLKAVTYFEQIKNMKDPNAQKLANLFQFIPCIQIGEGATRIDTKAFASFPTREVRIPASVRYIVKGAFNNGSKTFYVVPGSYAEQYVKENFKLGMLSRIKLKYV